MGAVQIQKGARQDRGVGRSQAQVGQGRGGVEQRIGQGFLHVDDHAFRIARRQRGQIDAEFLRQTQQHARGNRTVVVFHLRQIGQRHPQPFGKAPLGQPAAAPRFAQRGACIDFLSGHDDPPSLQKPP